MIRRFYYRWVKHNGNQAVQVSTVGIKNIDGLKENLKIKLAPDLNAVSSSRITFQQTLTSNPLRASHLISEINQIEEVLFVV